MFYLNIEKPALAAANARIGPTEKKAVSELIKVLNDCNSKVRRYAAHALGQIGPEAKDAMPALVVAIHDQSLNVRNSAAYALRCIKAVPDNNNAESAAVEI